MSPPSSVIMGVMPQRESIVAPPAGYSTQIARLAEMEASLSLVIRGKPDVVRLSLVCLLARGHLLIEDVPGVGKTTLAQVLARSVNCRFHRLQFTSDMLPSDVLGVTIYNVHSGAFEFKPGPIFANFLLADEINRTTPKTQSALLEAMNESQVTIDGKSHSLPRPFMVIATQNPVEHHGTYPLPESQLDRFLMRLRIGYPDAASEGESPRASQALYRAVQALALVEGREYAIPDDVKRLAGPVFAHRIVINTRTTLAPRIAGAGERIIEEILSQVEVPL